MKSVGPLLILRLMRVVGDGEAFEACGRWG